MKCEKCNGSGEIQGREHELLCDECFGSGEVKDKEPISNTPMITFRDEHQLALYEDALNGAIMELLNDKPVTSYILCELRDKLSEALKDARFEQERNPLPFPEQ